MLGTDFKAGQTKAKTAIVEYLRRLGLQPRTIASYNHLGNNDMRNLQSPRTWKAKERVKTDVFGEWTKDGSPSIDHKVAVLYTEQMGDEKRDTVEYTVPLPRRLQPALRPCPCSLSLSLTSLSFDSPCVTVGGIHGL